MRIHHSVFALLACLGTAYAWFSQPYVGPPSARSAAVRAAVVVAWVGIAFVVVNRKLGKWSWKKFVVGFLFGGGWLAGTFPGGGTLANSIVIVSGAMVFGSISGLFSGVTMTMSRAALVGVGIFLAQVALDLGVLVLGLSKIRFGM